MSTREKTALNERIYEEACEWFVDFRSGDNDAATRRRFDAWTRTSPEHLRAYLEIAAIWNEGHALGGKDRFSVAALTEHVRAESNVIALETPVLHASTAASRQKRPFKKTSLAIAASLAGTLLVGAIIWLSLVQRSTYSTDVGEQRSIALADGSTVELNSRSKIRVSFDKNQRVIHLVAGQALFQVAKESQRPFVVYSDRAKVRVLGTQFDVYRKKSGTVVTVLEGRVEVAPDGRSGRNPAAAAAMPPTRLGAGEQLTVSSEVISPPVSANVSATTAWTRRQLIFESASLDEVAEEFNRYNTRRLVIQNVAPDDFHISGVFLSTDMNFLVRFLRERLGVTVRETESEILVSH